MQRLTLFHEQKQNFKVVGGITVVKLTASKVSKYMRDTTGNKFNTDFCAIWLQCKVYHVLENQQNCCLK